MLRDEKDVETYLARIRKTIADSKRLVSQVELRIAETDRMLERQGLTREQVMAMRFSEAQKDAVDAELKRRGLDPLVRWDMAAGYEAPEPSRAFGNASKTPAVDSELDNRQRKFGMMMKPFQI